MWSDSDMLDRGAASNMGIEGMLALRNAGNVRSRGKLLERSGFAEPLVPPEVKSNTNSANQ